MVMQPRRNRLLSLEKHENLAGALTIELIMTPWEEVTKVDQAAEVQQAKSQMQDPSNEFDQLGVQDGHRTGLIRIESICEDSDASVISGKVEWSGENQVLQSDTDLMQALKALVVKPSYLVQEVGETVGLVHRSDFNKQLVRSYFYLWLSALEIGLAEFVRRELPDHDVWIQWLRDSSKVNVAGNLYLAKRDNARLNAIEYVELSDFANILKNSDKVGKELWRALGYNSKNKCGGEIGSLVDLRHRIMHPVRTLVSDASSAGEMINWDRLLKSRVNQLVALLR